MRIKKHTAKTAKALKPDELMLQYDNAVHEGTSGPMRGFFQTDPNAWKTAAVLRKEIVRRLAP